MTTTVDSATLLATLTPLSQSADTRLSYESPTLARLPLTAVVAGASGHQPDDNFGAQL